MTLAGFPHSDIFGSTPACDSPKLFAANHVLHRLLTPRHSSCALSSLTTNLFAPGRSREAKNSWWQSPPKFATRRSSSNPVLAVRTSRRRVNSSRTRSRSKLHEGAPSLDSFDARFHSKTRFRVVTIIRFSETDRRVLQPPAKEQKL
jgi:hypothetical protein